MQITFRFFGSLREAAGAATCTLDLPQGTRLEQVVARLVAQYPELDGHQASWHFAVNRIHAEPERVLQPGDHLSIFPYIAGG